MIAIHTLFGATCDFPPYKQGIGISVFEKKPTGNNIIRNVLPSGTIGNSGITKKRKIAASYVETWLEKLKRECVFSSIGRMLFVREKALLVSIRPIGLHYHS